MPYQKRSRSGRHSMNGQPRPGGNYGRNRNKRRSAQRSGRGRSKVSINPQKFINKAVEYTEEQYKAEHHFNDFPFDSQLKSNIAKKGYETPSPIQDQAIPHIIDGKDVIGLANTGTGKTAAFLLPIINRISGIAVRPSVLIIAPTRELAQQINDQFREFSRGMNLHSALLVGGMNIDRQIRELRRRPHVVIGTPGRMKDLIERRQLNLKNIVFAVLDEADRMLDMGFLPDIRNIISNIPNDRQSLFFSATMTKEVERIAQEFLQNPVTVSVKTGETSDHVDQDIVEFVDKDHKIELLTHMLTSDEYKKVLVFGETKFGVQRLSDKLNKLGIPSVAIHGNKSQNQRQRALKDFTKHKVKVLVATDVAARGLDIVNVSHVINFDTPQTYDDYVHRIGRTGRGGEKGQAYTFVPRKKQR